MKYQPGDVLQPGWQEDTEAGFDSGLRMGKAWRNKETEMLDPEFSVRRLTYREARERAKHGEFGDGASPHCRALYLGYCWAIRNYISRDV